MFTHTKQITTTYSLDDIIKYTTDLIRNTNNRQLLKLNKVKHTKICFTLLSNYIKENRYAILKTFSSYKIITNGYGEFTYIEITEGLENDNLTITASEIFNRIKHNST